MPKFNKTPQYSLILLIVLVLSGITSMKLIAQDDINVNEDEVLAPAINNGVSAPIPIIDESDSASVPETEEYDG
jgi:hypothetical protein